MALVKDEVDVIDDAIRHALTFADVVSVLDNGSEDGSAEVIEGLVREFPGRVRSYGVDRRPFVIDLRRGMYDDLRGELGADDWFLVLDADEFLARDPRPALSKATAAGFNQVATWQAQFQFTDVDLAEWERGGEVRCRPVTERLRYYRVDWREGRFFRNNPERPWEGNDHNIPEWAPDQPRWAVLNRHYQYRDPDQIQKRLVNRVNAKSDTAFVHESTTDWHSKVVPSEGLRYWSPGSNPRALPWRYYRTMAKVRLGRD